MQQIDIFGNAVEYSKLNEKEDKRAIVRKQLKRIEYMHAHHGKTRGMKCEYCSQLTSITFCGRRRYKCKMYGVTSSEATDWAKGNEACGRFS